MEEMQKKNQLIKSMRGSRKFKTVTLGLYPIGKHLEIPNPKKHKLTRYKMSRKLLLIN
jgi:hypothetical protein